MNASPTGSTIPIYDAAGNAWTVVAGVIQKNGANAGYSANVALLLFYGGTIYQQNAAGNWWSWNGTGWTATTDPRAAPAPAPTPTPTPAPAPAPAPTLTAAGLLAWLKSLQGKKIAIGQHTSYWDGDPLDYVEQIAAATAKYPAILGVSTGMVGSTDDVVGISNAWIAAGGVPLVSWWPPDPITGSWDDKTPMAAANFASLTQPGTPGYIAWQKLLAAQVALLKQIKGPVIYRPMLEMNGNWSWWQDQDAKTYQLLWQQMHAYFVANGVTNVLWHFCPNAGGNSSNFLAYYPGDDVVDIVGVDQYIDTPGPEMVSSGAYPQLTSTGKPFIIGEAGIQDGDNSDVKQMSFSNDAYLQSVLANCPLVVAIVFFCQNWGIPVQQGMAALMAEAVAVVRGGVPAGVG